MSGVPSWAVKGAKVVCILHVPPQNLPIGVVNPTVGAVYTIREVHFEAGETYLRFDEIQNAVQEFSDGTMEPAYHVEGYRPLVTRTAEQDIAEHFSHHLRQPEAV